MLKKIKQLVFGKPPVEMNHPFFGKMLFMGKDKPREDDHWEAELEIKEAEEPIIVLIDAGREGPTDKHIAFFQKCVSDLNALFDKCWPIFEPDFEQWTGKPFSGKWTDEFELMSIEIPRDADDSNEWTVGYYVDAAKHYFTARFIDGKATYNEIDG